MKYLKYNKLLTMAIYIPDDLLLPVAESTRISNDTVELIQTGLPSFDISDSYQDPKPDPRQVHRGLELPDKSFHPSDDLTFESIEGGTHWSNTYRTPGPINEYIKLLFALPFLPQEHIIPSFTEIAVSGSSDIQPLLHYMKRTWMSGTM